MGTPCEGKKTLKKGSVDDRARSREIDQKDTIRTRQSASAQFIHPSISPSAIRRQSVPGDGERRVAGARAAGSTEPACSAFVTVSADKRGLRVWRVPGLACVARGREGLSRAEYSVYVREHNV